MNSGVPVKGTNTNNAAIRVLGSKLTVIPTVVPGTVSWDSYRYLVLVPTTWHTVPSYLGNGLFLLPGMTQFPLCKY